MRGRMPSRGFHDTTRNQESRDVAELVRVQRSQGTLDVSRLQLRLLGECLRNRYSRQNRSSPANVGPDKLSKAFSAAFCPARCQARQARGVANGATHIRIVAG